MSYQAGKNTWQYRCKNCKTVSPHDKRCFVCGSEDKEKEMVPTIVPKRDKGMSINIKMR